MRFASLAWNNPIVNMQQLSSYYMVLVEDIVESSYHDGSAGREAFRFRRRSASFAYENASGIGPRSPPPPYDLFSTRLGLYGDGEARNKYLNFRTRSEWVKRERSVIEEVTRSLRKSDYGANQMSDIY
ncbi:hypothetical protein HAX54_029743 [Datura stramonium]|uniref:Uncharacterized protein n=1 Tax=Datura stramonium TaxID=4076 RepID=A0ABS8SAH0_DATST|nr:hypothetical protein [Datura stramonium]